MSDQPMTLNLAASITRAHLEAQFPRACGCGRVFTSLADYLRRTVRISAPVSFDGDDPDLSADPIGTMSFANCACGTTLSLSSEGMAVETLISLMRWAREEVVTRGVTIGVLLMELRTELDRVTLEA